MTDQDIMDISGLIYHRWSGAAQNLDRVKKETDNGSPDWAEFHEIRFETAVAEEWHWLQLRNKWTEEHRAILNKAFGI